MGKLSKKFTLIELLVVIAIISLLMSILLPSLSKARNSGKDAVCKSNERQISIAINSYTLSNSDLFPSHRIEGPGGDYSWIELLEMESYDLFLCPRVAKWNFSNGTSIVPDVSTVDGRTHRSAYGYNGFWLGLSKHVAGPAYPLGRNYTSVTDCVNPAEVIMAGDATPSLTGGWASTTFYYFRKNPYTGFNAVHGLTGQDSNIAFVDGHVVSLKASEVNLNDSEYKDLWNPNPSVYSVPY